MIYPLSLITTQIYFRNWKGEVLLGVVGEGLIILAFFKRLKIHKWEFGGVDIIFSDIRERQKINNTEEKVKEFLYAEGKYISIYKNSDYI